MKHAAITSQAQHSSLLHPEKTSYLQNFQAFANSALADKRFTSIVDFLDTINKKATEIVSQAANEGIADTFELQMEIFDLARQYAGRYNFA